MQVLNIEAPTNGLFALVKQPYGKAQHPNQQCGLDIYVDVIDLVTGNKNSLKLYDGVRGRYFKKNGTHYLSDFTKTVTVVPYQYYIN